MWEAKGCERQQSLALELAMLVIMLDRQGLELCEMSIARMQTSDSALRLFYALVNPAVEEGDLQEMCQVQPEQPSPLSKWRDAAQGRPGCLLTDDSWPPGLRTIE